MFVVNQNSIPKNKMCTCVDTTDAVLCKTVKTLKKENILLLWVGAVESDWT